MDNIFTNKIILVTGGSSGIGLACVKKMAALGATIIAVDCKSLNDCSHLLIPEKKLLQSVDYQVCDLADISLSEKLFNYIEEKYNKLDGAVNNAGTLGTIGKKFSDYSLEDYEYVMNINARAVWFCMQKELLMMEKNHSGSIVNVSSVAGLRGSMLSALYSMSKFAVNGLTCAAALEYAKRGIRINSLCPGPTDTPLSQNASSFSEKILETIPAGRVGTAEEIANFITWLLSNEASFVTGAVIPVDGGIIAKL